MTEPVTNPREYPEHSPQSKRPISATSLVMVFGIVALFTAFGIFGVWLASCSELPLGARLLGGLMVPVGWWFPLRVVWVQVRRRLKTGRWSLRGTDEERIAMRMRWMNTPAYARFLPARFRKDMGDRINFILAALWTPVAILLIYVVLRKHLHGSDLIFPAFWIAMTARTIWSLFRRRYTTTKPASS